MTAGPRRAGGGDDIDLTRPLAFTFDGRTLSGYEGDTLASALLANGVRVVGRSFKYHRPRGVFGAGPEEPNAIFDVTLDGVRETNVRGTMRRLRDGMAVEAVNAAPDAERDRYGFLDRLAAFLPAGFYYKTFMRPGWAYYEPRIRAMAGLGRMAPRETADRGEARHRQCDVLVVGGGPSGLAAADIAAAAGLDVVLVDDKPRLGGSLLARAATVDGKDGKTWTSDVAARLAARPNVMLLADSTAFALYDHNVVNVLEAHGEGPAGWTGERLWQLRARRIVLATGAIERPLVFPDNDRPGVISADAALTYLRRYGVRAGEKAVVATNNDTAYETARALAEAGAATTLVDARKDPDAAVVARASEAGVDVRSGLKPTGTRGRIALAGVHLSRSDGSGDAVESLEADVLAVSGGWTPTVHLFCQAKGALAWRDDIAAFLPAENLATISVVGAARGDFDPATAFETVGTVLDGILRDLGRPGENLALPAAVSAPYRIRPLWPTGKEPGRAWIDFQNDVTTKDIALSVRENFASVEHVKRYTTLGMATDQGKTGNVNGIALLAEITERSIPEVGTTTYRPPYSPVTIASLTGARRGETFAPPRRLPAEIAHLGADAVLRDYGGWLRPAYYGEGTRESEAVAAEAGRVRASAGLFDASSLGKIEVVGPDAGALLDFVFYQTISTLRVGRVRYALTLMETGIVFDDGVVARLEENRYVVSCSSSHIAAVGAALEEWRQDGFDTRGVVIHDCSPAWGTVAVAGPAARAVLKDANLDAANLDAALDDERLPHMGIAEATFDGGPCRIARVSFTGERSYEIAVPAARTGDLWGKLSEAAREAGGGPVGVEAIAVLRAEKGFIMIGKDTVGTTMPHDLGMDGPRQRKTREYVGKRSLHLPEALREDREQLVGLEPADEGGQIPAGAHSVEERDGQRRSTGFVTSSYWSPALNRPIALALIEGGHRRHGETVEMWHLGATRTARIVPPCFYDPKGERLHAG